MNQVRIAVLAGFQELVKELGCDASVILEQAGLSSTFFADHADDDMMAYEQAEKLMQLAADATQCSHFGLLLGTKQDINLLGIIGYVMQQSADVRTALKELCLHFALHVREASIIEISSSGDYASLTYTVVGDIPITRQTSELALSESMVILKTVCGPDWKPSAVNFSHAGPENTIAYRKIFGAPVCFDKEKSQILFPKSYLDNPIQQADPRLNKILKTRIEQLEADSHNSLCWQIESLIHRTLPNGKCTIENIAGLMAVHRRTLHRMLKEHDTSFTALLEKVRKSIARERLQNSGISITQLADYLGYADNSAFTRAFKRWHGVTPQQWKKQHS